MHDFNIDPSGIRRIVREAERKRAEALADLLIGAGRGVARAGVAFAHGVRAVYRRRRLTLPVPAPHR